MNTKIVTKAIVVLCGISGFLWAGTDTLTVLHVNDTHSHMLPYGPKEEAGIGKRGGIARAATLIGRAMAEEKNVLFFHGGDLFVGDFMFNKFFGVPELQILAQLGCDAMALGNHEFDLMPGTLKQALAAAGFPMPGFDLLSANLDMSKDPDLDAFVEPYAVKTLGELKVGIFGLINEEMVNVFSNPSPDSATSFLEGAQSAVDSLRSKCDVVIALTHLGVQLDSILAATVPGIDLIVGGHSHTVLQTPVKVTGPAGRTVWIVQAGAKYDYVGKTRLVYGPSGVENLSYELMPVDSSVPENGAVAATVQSLVAAVEADERYGPVYTQEIARAAADIDYNLGERFKDTPLGNLVTDAYRDYTKTDIALDVVGYFNQPIYAGPLTGADIFQAIPYGYDEDTGYGFEMMTFDLSGIFLRLGLEYTFEESRSVGDILVQASGMSIQYDSSKPMGNRLVSVMIDGQPLSLFTTYSVTANSGLYDFLDYAGLLASNEKTLAK